MVIQVYAHVKLGQPKNTQISNISLSCKHIHYSAINEIFMSLSMCTVIGQFSQHLGHKAEKKKTQSITDNTDLQLG